MEFYEHCEICSLCENPCAEKCFDCAGSQPSSAGWIHSLGIYYPRREKNSRYGTSKWSQAIIRLKRKSPAIVSVFGKLLSLYLRNVLRDFEPYVLTNVPGTTNDSKFLFPGIQICPTLLLALSAFQNLKDRHHIDMREPLRQAKQKPKKQHNCNTARERIRNVRNVYVVRDPLGIENKRIVLIDDVFTSGATMKECRTTLLNAGARKVIGVVLAKTHAFSA